MASKRFKKEGVELYLLTTVALAPMVVLVLAPTVVLAVVLAPPIATDSVAKSPEVLLLTLFFFLDVL